MKVDKLRIQGTDYDIAVPIGEGTAGQVLTINQGGTGTEWKTPQSGGADTDLRNNTVQIVPADSTKPYKFGLGGTLTGEGTAYGNQARANTWNDTAIGHKAVSSSGVAVGYNSGTSYGAAVAIGTSAKATYSECIQIGPGTNNEQFTFQIYNKNIYNHHTDTLKVANLTDGTTTKTMTEVLSGGTDTDLRNNTVQIEDTQYNRLLLGGASVGGYNSAQSVIIGKDAVAPNGCVVIGRSASSTDSYGTAVGWKSEVKAGYSIAIGEEAHVGTSGTSAIQLGSGINNTANTLQVHSKNIYNFDTDTLKVANLTDGTTTKTMTEVLSGGSGNYMSATNPVGSGTFSMNRKPNTTVGTNSSTFGYDCVASQLASHAEGQETKALGQASHAEGVATQATAMGAHSEGSNTIASSANSHAEGLNTQADSYCQHVSGKYNIIDSQSTYAEIIGNGTAEYNRSNARTLDWSGNEMIAGNLQAAGLTDGTTTKTMTEVLSGGTQKYKHHITLTKMSSSDFYWINLVFDTTDSEEYTLSNILQKLFDNGFGNDDNTNGVPLLASGFTLGDSPLIISDIVVSRDNVSSELTLIVHGIELTSNISQSMNMRIFLNSISDFTITDSVQ